VGRDGVLRQPVGCLNSRPGRGTHFGGDAAGTAAGDLPEMAHETRAIMAGWSARWRTTT